MDLYSVIKRDWSQLRFVISRNMIQEQYENLCFLALNQCDEAVRYIDLTRFDTNKYFNVCMSIIKKNPSLFPHIKKEALTEDQYYQLYKEIKKNKNPFN